MKTIVIAAQNGGAVKATLARNLAVAASHDNRDVLCLDLDPQGSLRAWWESRNADAPSMLDRDPAPNVLTATLNAAQAQSDLCIIDTPPAAPEWLAEALGADDLVLIPGSPLARLLPPASRSPLPLPCHRPQAPRSPTKPPASWRNMAVSRRSISHNGSAMRKPGPRGIAVLWPWSRPQPVFVPKGRRPRICRLEAMITFAGLEKIIYATLDRVGAHFWLMFGTTQNEADLCVVPAYG